MRLLDLFCGAGGAAIGYSRAGFEEIVGVDIQPQPRYPFTFVQADALTYPLDGFDAIHASPPCQVYSRTRKIHDGKPHTHQALIEPTRDLLLSLGVPWIIENVPGAPLRNPVVLTGPMFGLRVIRARLFESSIMLLTPDRPLVVGGTNSHRGYSRHSDGAEYVTVAGNNYNRVDGANAMGIGWTLTRKELSQAIPPAYTEFIGKQLIASLR
jgi:DNA (cytosine-5)-methyltransferase 1